MDLPKPLADGLRSHLAHLFPDHHVVAMEAMAPDTGATKGATTKAAGYGLPVRITIANHTGSTFALVWRIASANEFGHDRRADRAANQILAYDTFGTLPDHVRAVDVGAIYEDGHLESIAGGELYLLTTYASGTTYANDLRRIASERVATDADLARVDILARYLGALHVSITDTGYRRAIRDLIGHGEGIFGIVDGYPAGVPGAPPERLRAIEQRCVDWRWRLRAHEDARLARTHGDFHPFNVLFDGEQLTLLDASRGCAGDPADDITAMAVNYILFALDAPDAWKAGLGVLWQRFWKSCDDARPDPALLDVAPPFFAWRALVVCNPKFYPRLSARGRDQLLGLAERALDAGRLEPARADNLFQ